MILLTIGILTILAIASLVSWFIGTHNTMVGAEEDVEETIDNMKTEYQRRYDLLPKLADACRSHAKFEKDTMTLVAQARGGHNPWMKKGKEKTANEKVETIEAIDKAMINITATMEQYPTLKSSELYTKFMDETRITEDTIRLARGTYNRVVHDYNNYIRAIPNNIVAGMFRFEKRNGFQLVNEGAEYSPDVKL